MRAFLAAVVLYLGSLLAGMPMSWPFDCAVNVGFTPVHAEWRAPADGARRVVVLQHGIMRSSYALGRLARTLRAHGYEVHNPGYPSTRGRIEDHAAQLAREVEDLVAGAPIDALVFVGHSMGGLVIQEYLRRPDAVEPTLCVYVAVPHRGAVLADLRKDWFPYRWFMGTEAARQLSPGDPFHDREIPFLDRTEVIRGDLGEGNASIPGPDDGTVGLAEAMLPGVPCTTLPLGHTRISLAPRTAEEVLRILHRAGAEGSPSGR